MSFPRDAYPYTNFHELNLGYFIVHFREIFSQWADLYDQMLNWKNATDEELATWKAGVEADLDQREAALRAELETWKAQTGQDIAGWEDATLAALTAWQTATQAVFEAIRVEAAGSASAAAASAGDAATAKTAAETAQAAAEAAAASVQASAAQITTNTEDIADLKIQLNEFENNTFTHENPVDYGALITAEDCTAASSSYAENLVFADTENGISVTKSARVNMGAVVQFMDLPPASTANPKTYDFTITFDDVTGIETVYFYDGSTQVGSWAGGTIEKDGNTFKFTYTYQNQSTLRWQFGLLYSWQDTKLFNVTGLEQNFNYNYKILPSTVEDLINELSEEKINELFGGLFADAFSAATRIRDNIAYNDKAPVKINEVLKFATWSQGACCIGNKWVGFSASSPDDHTVSNGRLYIGDFPITGTSSNFVYHNLGHCASADYDATTDTIVVANGTTGTASAEISLIKNVQTFLNNPYNIDYANTINILFNDLDGANHGCIACFGENYNIIYLCTADELTTLESDTKRYIYKILLGTGTADLTSEYSEDSYGTYTAAGDYEYNGTAHILEKNEITFKGEYQGLKYNGNMLLFPVDFRYNGILTGWIIGIKFDVVGTQIAAVRMINMVKSDGTAYIDEVEDMVIYNGEYYIPTMLREYAGGNIIYRTAKFVM